MSVSVSVSVRVICPFSVDKQLVRGRLCEQWVCELASYVDLSPHPSAPAQCTRTCVGGYQRRRVECYLPAYHIELPRVRCNHLTRPEIFQYCNTNVPCGECVCVTRHLVSHWWET